MIAYCGIDCAKCQAYRATKSGDAKQVEQVAKVWSKKFKALIKPEHIICDGCKVDERKSYHCQNLCDIRKCCFKNGFSSCAECKHFTCEELEFVLATNPDAARNLANKIKN